METSGGGRGAAEVSRKIKKKEAEMVQKRRAQISEGGKRGEEIIREGKEEQREKVGRLRGKNRS